MVQFLGQIIDIRDRKLSDELRFIYYLVQPTMEVKFSGHQWLVLPPYLHPNVPTFFYPTQLGISAPLWPQAPVVQPEPVQPEPVQPEGDFISSASDLVSCKSPFIISLRQNPQSQGLLWKKRIFQLSQRE